jgi:hypothetical protein
MSERVPIEGSYYNAGVGAMAKVAQAYLVGLWR